MQDNNQNPLKSYFRQPKIYITLPSGGNFWPEGTLELPENREVPVFSMSAKDEIMMKTPDALISGQSTVDVIQSCIPAIKNAWKIPIIDLDAILVAIRIASYGETMDLEIKTPVTAEQKTYALDLRQILDSFLGNTYESKVYLNNMTVNIRPITYEEFTQTALKTFEEQRIFKVLNDEKISEVEKITVFQESFKKLTAITIANLERSISSIELGDTTVSNPDHIKEFVENSDKEVFKSLTDHIDAQRSKFVTKPLTLQATQEELEKGVPETYEVPVSFDSSNFFG